MAKQERTKGVELEKYDFYIPEDKEAAKEMEGRAWNHRKLKKVITNDYILSYQEILEMKLVFVSQLESAIKDKEILEEKVISTGERIKDLKESVAKWEDEQKLVEKDIPEIGEIAAKERKDDAEKAAKHQANLEGTGEGRALEMDEDGNMRDITGSESKVVRRKPR